MTPSPLAMDPGTEAYRPGVCNIGPAEIARRRRTGWLGMVVAATLAAAMLVLGAPPAVRWLVGLPLAAGAAGFLQARFRFCAAYGLTGVRNLGPLGSVERVEDRGARRADLARAITLGLGAAAIGLAGAALLVALPA